MSSNSNRALLNCEALDSRDNPSGNVTAYISGGMLVLNGDALDNQVQVQQNSSGDIIVSGGNGTTVNGATAVYLGRGVPTRVEANMGSGNDQLIITGLLVDGDMNLNGSTGHDSLLVANSSVTGTLRAFGADGDDQTYLTGVWAGNLYMDGWTGTDGFHADSSYVAGSLVIVNQEYQF